MHAVEAVTAGADAYVEKPFAETMQDAREALRTVRASDRIVQIGSQPAARDLPRREAVPRLREVRPIVACEMSWNVNQPGRWRRPELVAG